MRRTEAERQKLILQIRKIAGELGDDADLEKAADADIYDFQVMTGLAEAVVEILENRPSKLSHWLGYCLIQYGIEPNERISALIDALENEVLNQLEVLDEEEEGESR